MKHQTEDVAGVRCGPPAEQHSRETRGRVIRRDDVPAAIQHNRWIRFLLRQDRADRRAH
jgi:hypothetical protein